MPTVDCRSPPPAPATTTASRRRRELVSPSSLRGATRRSNPFLPAATWIASQSLSSGAHSRDPLARNDGGARGASRIIRRVRLSEHVDGIAGLQVAAGECRIGVEREIGHRKHADAVKSPDCDPFHRRAFTPRTEKRLPAQGRRFGTATSNFVPCTPPLGRLTSASFIASSFWSIAIYCPCQYA